MIELLSSTEKDAGADKPATLPHPHPSVSFWMARARHSDLISRPSTSSSLPKEADCVVIGSGMAGSLIAYFLLSAKPHMPNGVVCLEAREAISGATARNGGHCRPDCYRGYSAYKKLHGAEQAMKVLQNEMDTLDLVEQLVNDEKIDCDFWRGRSFDAMMTDVCKADYRSAYDDFVSDGGNVQHVEWIDDITEARKATRVKNVRGAASFPAGSFYPYKFTAHLLSRAVAMGLDLRTTTPVVSVHPSDDGFWTVNTPDGSIRTKQVVHATNAYATAILPEMMGKIIPRRAQCSSITPTKAFSGKNMLTHTMSMYRKRGDFDYLIQRPADGTMILGGGKVADRMLEAGNCDDSTVAHAITEHLAAALKENLEGWGDEAVGEGLERVWTGVIGYTDDCLPYVGPLPGKEGQFICAGFHGHGMARIATSARGAAMVVRGRPWEETGLPECFQVTKERLSRTIRL